MMSMMLIRVLQIITALAATAVLAARSSPQSTWPPVVQPIPSPSADNSGQPQLTASGRGVVLSWVERHGQRATLKMAERTNDGWSEPRVVSSGSNWFVNWADVPAVIRLAGGTLASHWLEKSGPDSYAYDVRISYSQDDGKTWSPSFTPHSDGTKTQHGFATLFQMPGAGLGLVWLDGRATKPDSSHAEHEATGPMTVRFATFDRSWKQTSEVLTAARRPPP
jgi:hypothetical protein